MSTHEDYSREQEIVYGSDRSFGLVFAVAFALICLWPLREGGAPRWWAAAVAAVCLALALWRPAILHPLNVVWMRLGLLLGRIVSPIVLGVVFFLVVTPTAWVLRLAGKDPMRIRFDRTLPTYWVKRDPPGPDPQSMKFQF